jgi:hypothetical protein
MLRDVLVLVQLLAPVAVVIVAIIFLALTLKAIKSVHLELVGLRKDLATRSTESLN